MATKSPTSGTPKTLQAAVLYFSDPKRCLDYVVSRRWPNGVICPTCGSSKVHFLAKQARWKCNNKGEHKQGEKLQFSAKVGTIFEESPIPFTKWLPAMWLLANCKNGISSYELARGIGVTQKTAWFMLQRLRLAMQEKGGGKLGGPGSTVEVDETFIGGNARKMNKKQRAKAITPGKGGSPYSSGKEIVLGMLERSGRVRLRHIKRVDRRTLLSEVVTHVDRASEVHTDELSGYNLLRNADFAHKIVNHAETYVDGTVHTQGIENFWSLLKRAIRGTYVSVEPFHLFRYLDEQAYRFNTRKQSDGERFSDALTQVDGKRLTYKQLTGSDSAAPAS